MLGAQKTETSFLSAETVFLIILYLSGVHDHPTDVDEQRYGGYDDSKYGTALLLIHNGKTKSARLDDKTENHADEPAQQNACYRQNYG